MQYGPSSWIELSRAAFDHNVEQLARLCGRQKIAVVLKANAYGHGLRHIGQLCQENKAVAFICVAFLSEALVLRNHGVTKPILVMCFIDADPVEAARKQIHFFVSTMRQVEQLASAGRAARGIFDLHLKVDTGLSRFGVMPGEAVGLARKIVQCCNVRLVGLCTHFAQSYEVGSDYVLKQHTSFLAVCDQIAKVGILPAYIHSFNSTGVLRGLPGGNLVRVGAAVYGLWPSPEIRKLTMQCRDDFSLRPVLLWKTRIAELRVVPAGTCVGYDCLFKTRRQTQLAILPVGYTDGYATPVFNGGVVCIRGQLVPVVGKVAMNTVTVDVTDIPGVAQADEVALLGVQGGASAQELAERVGRNVREVAVLINPQIPRRIVKSFETQEQVCRSKEAGHQTHL